MAKRKRTNIDMENTIQKTIFFPTARFFTGNSLIIASGQRICPDKIDSLKKYTLK